MMTVKLKLANSIKVAIIVFIYVLLSQLALIHNIPTVDQLYISAISAGLSAITYYMTSAGITPPPTMQQITWQQWAHDFLTGRTHDTYGMIILVFIFLIFIYYIRNGWIFAGAIVGLIISVGVLVDLVAHLYYH
jgi:hypothetical protein